MESFGRTSVVFVNGQSTEFDKVELLESGVLKALQLARAAAPAVQVQGYTTYKVSYFSPQAWAGMHPASTVSIADDSQMHRCPPYVDQ